MSAQQVIAEIESLAKEEQLLVLDYVQRKALAEVPESFRRGMMQALSGEGVEMETALRETPPSRR
ncbi:MAG: hypothetical protein HY301_04350 [Verrucomicrobia bacterium]|nr:hypothetical protein [Verrucomicrobiota bacterium]